LIVASEKTCRNIATWHWKITANLAQAEKRTIRFGKCRKARNAASAASTQGAVRDRRLMVGGVIRGGGAELTDDIVEEVDESEGGRVDCQ